ncbi:MAG: hypothetical protein J5750_07800, partial [Clostridiales bacterium]|nr:hypothetical protein [Clostridiales bacterium]
MNHLKTAMLVLGVLIVVVAILLVGCKSSETTKKPTKEPKNPTDSSDKLDAGKKKKLSFESFEGGGYSYSVTIDDESVATCSAKTEYEGDKNAKGASYEYVITVKAVAPGETGMTVYGQSDLLGEVYHYYKITVEDDLMLTLEEIDAPYGVTGPAATNGGDNESRAVVKHSS